MSIHRLVIPCTLLAAATSLLAAQTPLSEAQFRLRQVIVETSPQTQVRVQLRDGQLLTGTLGPSTPDTLVLAVNDGYARVALTEVTALWRRGHSSGRGALTGGILGALAGGVLNEMFEGTCDPGTCSSGTTAGAALLSGVIGAGIGLVIGSAIPSWHRAWRGKPGPEDRLVAPPPAIAIDIRRDSARAMRPPSTRNIGRVFLLGSAGLTSRGSGPGGAAHSAAIGASLGLQSHFGAFGFGPELRVLRMDLGTIVSVAGTGRVDLRRRATPEMRIPYLIFGAGIDIWPIGPNVIVGDLGLGLTLHQRHRVEARWHPEIGNEGADARYLTVGAGWAFGW